MPITDLANLDFIQLMTKDTVLAEFRKGVSTYWNPDNNLNPFPLRGIEPLNPRDLADWLVNRVAPLDRYNMTKLLMRISTVDRVNRLDIALYSMGLSLNDTFWVRTNMGLNWNAVSLYRNKFSDAIAELAFTGDSPITITTQELTPELNTGGLYAKFWKRELDGIWLYKSNQLCPNGSEFEYISDLVLTVLGWEHVNYTLTTFNDITVSKCLNFTSEQVGFVSAYDVHTFLLRSGNLVFDFAKRVSATKYYKMLILDAIINNEDRHMKNWGFIFNTDTGSIIDLAPLFDHNRAFAQRVATSKFANGDSVLQVGEKAAKILQEKGYNIVSDLERLESALHNTKSSFTTCVNSEKYWVRLLANTKRLLKHLR